MKIYQSIHKYGPHIPAFELRHGITDATEISFSALQKLVIDDGYASVYRLEPSAEDVNSEVFFTIWNYERLQLIWAKENGIDDSSSMNEIRVAQAKWFNPDVVYDFSGRYRPNFISELKEEGVKATTALWNGVIEQNEKPKPVPGYDFYVSLHRPYVRYWQQMGLESFELQPSISSEWLNLAQGTNRTVDILMYGQSLNEYFTERNAIVRAVLNLKEKYQVSAKLQIDEDSKAVFGEQLNDIDPPVYSHELYDSIRNSKIVINKCTDNNLSYKSNMRVFEAIGNGALLLAEKGGYPEGLSAGKDYLPYASLPELLDLIDMVLDDWEKWSIFATAASIRLLERFSKERQWNLFFDNVSSRKDLENDCG